VGLSSVAMAEQSGRKITAGIIAALTVVGALGSGKGAGSAIFGAVINVGIVFAFAALIDIVRIKMPKSANTSLPTRSSIENTDSNKKSKNLSTNDAPPAAEKWDPPMHSSGYMKGAGWYKDPSRKYDQRYFAGANWTVLVKKRGEVMRSDDTKESEMSTQSLNRSQSKVVTSVGSLETQTEVVRQETSPSSVTDDLRLLSKMFQDGLLTSDEFAAAKKKILG